MSDAIEPWFILLWTITAASFAGWPIWSIRKARQRGWFRFGWSPRYSIAERRPLFHSWVLVQVPMIVLGGLLTLIGAWGFLVTVGILK